MIAQQVIQQPTSVSYHSKICFTEQVNHVIPNTDLMINYKVNSETQKPYDIFLTGVNKRGKVEADYLNSHPKKLLHFLNHLKEHSKGCYWLTNEVTSKKQLRKAK